MAYLRFILDNLRSLSYGFLLALFSTFGQTAFIAVYGGEVMALYDLTAGEYGLIYMLATLTSAAIIGQQRDPSLLQYADWESLVFDLGLPPGGSRQKDLSARSRTPGASR